MLLSLALNQEGPFQSASQLETDIKSFVRTSSSS